MQIFDEQLLVSPLFPFFLLHHNELQRYKKVWKEKASKAKK